MDIQIEVASLKDLMIMVELERQCFTSEAFSIQQFSYLLMDDNSICLVARVNGKLVGFVISQLESEGKMVFGHIITLNVAVIFRRQGVAQKLLSKSEELLKLRGVTECRLEARQDNYVALKLYRHLGYVEICLLKRYYGKEHGLYLKKIFTP